MVYKGTAIPHSPASVQYTRTSPTYRFILSLPFWLLDWLRLAQGQAFCIYLPWLTILLVWHLLLVQTSTPERYYEHLSKEAQPLLFGAPSKYSALKTYILLLLFVWERVSPCSPRLALTCNNPLTSNSQVLGPQVRTIMPILKCYYFNLCPICQLKKPLTNLHEGRAQLCLFSICFRVQRAHEYLDKHLLILLHSKQHVSKLMKSRHLNITLLAKKTRLYGLPLTKLIVSVNLQ